MKYLGPLELHQTLAPREEASEDMQATVEM